MDFIVCRALNAAWLLSLLRFARFYLAPYYSLSWHIKLYMQSLRKLSIKPRFADTIFCLLR